MTKKQTNKQEKPIGLGIYFTYDRYNYNKAPFLTLNIEARKVDLRYKAVNRVQSEERENTHRIVISITIIFGTQKS